MDNIVADSSFYIFFFKDISCTDHLNSILDVYKAYIGPSIKGEINHHLESNLQTKSKINDMSTGVDFQNILEQYQISLLAAFPKMQKWSKKGEFEVIGISYFLKQLGMLKYLVVDDKSPYIFIKNQLKFINGNLTRTFGFLISGVVEDKVLSKSLLEEVMEMTEDAILSGCKPINIDEAIWNEEVKPNLTRAFEGYNG